jgi:hypothetical protein
MVPPMKRRALLLLLSPALAMLLTACQPMRFTQYNGGQETWPAGTSFSAQVFDVPVYYALPERSYDVMGYIQFEDPATKWNLGDIKLAAALAKNRGGNALLMLMGGQPDTPTLRSFRQALGLDGDHTTAAVLRWN